MCGIQVIQCGNSLLYIAGLCKHVHLAMFVAAGKGTPVETIRSLAVEALFASNAFSQDDDTLEIFNEDGEVNIVNMRELACSCVAYSYGLRCIYCTLA